LFQEFQLKVGSEDLVFEISGRVDKMMIVSAKSLLVNTVETIVKNEVWHGLLVSPRSTAASQQLP